MTVKNRSFASADGLQDFWLSAFVTESSAIVSLSLQNDCTGAIAVQYPFVGAETAFLQGDGALQARICATLAQTLHKQVFVFISNNLELQPTREPEYINAISALLA